VRKILAALSVKICTIFFWTRSHVLMPCGPRHHRWNTTGQTNLSMFRWPTARPSRCAFVGTCVPTDLRHLGGNRSHSLVTQKDGNGAHNMCAIHTTNITVALIVAQGHADDIVLLSSFMSRCIPRRAPHLLFNSIPVCGTLNSAPAESTP